MSFLSSLRSHRAALAFIFVTAVLDIVAMGIIIPVLPGLIEVVESCSAPDRAPALAFQARMLEQAITDLLTTIAEEFLGSPGSDAQAALAAYRRDHLWTSAYPGDTSAVGS